MSGDSNSYNFKDWQKNFKTCRTSSTDIPTEYDTLLMITLEADLNPARPYAKELEGYFHVLNQYKAVDSQFDSDVSFVCVPIDETSSMKVVHSPVGPLNRDYDDVRRFAEAAYKGVKRAVKSGAKKLLVLIPDANKEVYDISSNYKRFALITLLGALEAHYVPLEVREIKHRKPQLLNFGVSNFRQLISNEHTFRLATAIESGRIVCRDIGGSDPERMAPPKVASYVKDLFLNTAVQVQIIEEETVLQKQYPLLAAVNRAARGIERHRARVILLTYEPEGPYETTLVLVGKGVTYDTGGADIKAGGVMAGMHRDKCGAAAVAGFFQVLSVLEPKGIKVLGAMCMVRNSVGSDCYVSDEIITSRCGRRVRVGNTDAEGRMAMADALCQMKEKVAKEKDPHLFTIATLTGHACLACGDGYSVVMDNGPAKNAGVGSSLQKAGDVMGDMFEISTIRREDYEFHQGKSVYEDLLQCNNLPSSKTARGHQTPAAFLIMSSGLDKHGIDSENPLKYCHIDIAASSGPFPGIPSGAPIPALVNRFIMQE